MPVALADKDSFEDLEGSAFVDGKQLEHQMLMLQSLVNEVGVLHYHKIEVLREDIEEEESL